MGRGSNEGGAELISRGEHQRRARDLRAERLSDPAAEAAILELHESGLRPDEIVRALNQGLARDPAAEWNEPRAWSGEVVRAILRRVEAKRGEGLLVQRAALDLMENLATEGLWPDEIAQELNDNDFKAIRGKTWTPGSVLSTLRSRGWHLDLSGPHS